MLHNPVTPQILGHYREGSSGYRVLTILFDKYWDEIADFAKEHRLAMPTHYLGMGETGIVLRAGKRVMKILTLSFNNQPPEDDLRMLEYLSQYRLPGFARVDAILPLRVRYWQGKFLTDLKEHKSTKISWDRIRQVHTKRKVPLSASWRRRIARLARQKDSTWIIWLEKLSPKNVFSVMGKYHRKRKTTVEKQFEFVREYTKIAMDAFDLDYRRRPGPGKSWYVLHSRYDLNDIGQDMSWDNYTTAKEQISEYLDWIFQKAPLFQDLIGSLQLLLDEDIIVSDIREDNMGIKWIGDEPVPTIFDAIFHPLNP